MAGPRPQLVIDRSGGIVVATLQSRYPSDEDVAELRVEFGQLLADQGVKNIILDFVEVEFFDANLRGQLAWPHRELAMRDGRLAVCNLGVMRKHPTLVQFARVMAVVADVPEAMAALRAGGAGDNGNEGRATPGTSSGPEAS